MMTNLKPADELFTVRNRIKALQAREKELADAIKAGDLDGAGDFALATAIKKKTSRFDRKAAEAEFGDLSRFVVSGETVALMVSELASVEEGA